MLRLLFLLIIISITDTKLFGQWQKENISDYLGWIQETKIGEGRNDDTNRVYIANQGNNRIHELTWNGQSWDRIEIDSSLKAIRDLVLAEGRNDGITRIYSTDETYAFYELSWNGMIWEKDSIGLSGASGVGVGPGRNDGVNRIYVPDPVRNILHEYSWDNGIWLSDTISGASQRFYKPIVADGRKDDTTRVYAASHDNHIYEFSWNGNVWNVKDVGSGTDWMWGVAVGDGRNDGVNRVYGANRDGHLYEFTWNGISWEETNDLIPTAAQHLTEVCLGQGRNDDINRVYCTGPGSGLVEFSWNENEWAEANLGSEYDGLTIGDGRNDGIMRVYAAESYLTEYTYTPSGIKEQNLNSGIPRRIILGQNYPNPFNPRTVISWQLAVGSDVELSIYNLSGQKVATLVSGIQKAGFHEVEWDASGFASGVYLYRLSVGTVTRNFVQTKKMILLR